MIHGLDHVDLDRDWIPLSANVAARQAESLEKEHDCVGQVEVDVKAVSPPS